MTIYGGPEIVDDNLLWYIDAANPKSYPGSGTTVADLCGTGVDGTLLSENIGTVSSSVFAFNGSTDRITFANTRALDATTGNYTWNCWFKASSTASDYRELWYANATGGAVGFGVMLNNSGTQLRQEIYGSSGGRQFNIETITSYLDDWLYATYTVDSSTFEVDLYLNGQYYTTYSEADWGSIDSTSSLVIGMHGTSTTWPFDGEIALMSIYSEKLTPVQILHNYNSTKGRFL